jgi:hypothetical protein
LQEVNRELKEIKATKEELLGPQALYFAGIARRTVNPYYVVELKPLLQVGESGSRPPNPHL